MFFLVFCAKFFSNEMKFFITLKEICESNGKKYQKPIISLVNKKTTDSKKSLFYFNDNMFELKRSSVIKTNFSSYYLKIDELFFLILI